MTPVELVRELVERAGGDHAVARAMGAPTFQGTLYKYIHGQTDSPARRTADRIARHFKISVEAIYDAKVAAAEAARLNLGSARSPTATGQAVTAQEPPATFANSPWPLAPWISPQAWATLGDAQRAAVAWEAKKAFDAISAAVPAGPSEKQPKLRAQ